MTSRRKSGTQSSKQTFGPPDASHSESRIAFVVLWLLAVPLLWSANPVWLTDAVRIVPAPADSLLTPAAWSVPLSRVAALRSVAEWPLWLFLLAGAALIARLAMRLANRRLTWPAILVTLVFAVGMRPSDLIPAAACLALFALDRSETRQNRSKAALLALIPLLAVLATSLEFGLVFLFAAFLFLPAYFASLTTRQGVIQASGCLLLVVAIEHLAPGFTSALMRPISAAFLRQPPELLSSISFAPLSAHDFVATFLLCGFLIACWGRLFSRDSGSRPDVLHLLVFSLIALGAARHLWIATLAVAATLAPLTLAPTRRVVRIAMIAGSVAISAARLAGHSTYFLASLLDTPPPPRLIDPTRWETSGPVLLMNLDHASDWQTPRCRESFQLLLDDRWDIFDDLYPNYANVCRDIGNIRAISYLRSDGQWGGYIRWTNEWKPTLLVVDSRDRDVLRRLSLSPDWRVVGIDAKRTIYAWDDAPQNKRQLAYATNTFLRLEWPRPLPDDWDSRLLVAHEPREWRRVASVLSAMRLPYAALRTLPLDWEWETEKERAWAYTELAHRTHRHAAETSLLDQFRAVARLRRGLEESRFSGKEKVRIARGLAALDLAELAHEFEPFANAPPESKPSPDATPEQHLRHALARADAARFPQLLPQLSSSVRRFYEVLTSANHKTARELFIDLTTVLAAPQLPDRLRGEAWFYQGCLAIEAGDSQAATHAFTESQRTDPTSPFGSLRKFHLAQLAAR